MTTMRVALFIPCYVDQIKPQIGWATLRLLEALSIEVEFPKDQTCCGQPFLTAGETRSAEKIGRRYAEVFSGFDAIVAPSGSCVATIRQNLPRWAPGPEGEKIARHTFELCDFLVQDGRIVHWPGRFPHRVGLHASCHSLRELRFGNPSESRTPARSDPAQQLLEGLDEIKLVDLRRRDECCGFGGIFSVQEEAVSVRMGVDRLTDHLQSGAQVITSSDISCLIHLGGLAERRKLALRPMHVAEILAESLLGPEAPDGSR